MFHDAVQQRHPLLMFALALKLTSTGAYLFPLFWFFFVKQALVCF